MTELYLQAAIMDMNYNRFTRDFWEHGALPSLYHLELAKRMDTFQAFVNEQPITRLAAFALSNTQLWRAAAISALEDDTRRIDDATLESVAHLSDKLGDAHEARVDGYTCDTCGHDARNGKHDIPILGARYYEPPEDWYRCEPHLDYNLADEYSELDY